MKSPQGLIWNTPNRRKPFERDYRDLRAAELEQFFQEMEAQDTQAAEEDPPVRLRLVAQGDSLHLIVP